MYSNDPRIQSSQDALPNQLIPTAEIMFNTSNELLLNYFVFLRKPYVIWKKYWSLLYSVQTRALAAGKLVRKKT